MIKTLLIYYIIAVNILTFFTYGLDKWKACHQPKSNRSRRINRRIPEASLLLLAILGGSPAALLAMYLFRHKTLHKKFKYGVPVILLAQVALIAVILYWHPSVLHISL